MPTIRQKNRFGRRFVSLSELHNYAVDLDLGTHPPHNGFMEFLEREGILVPIAGLRFSPEFLRRFAQEDVPEKNVFQPIEPDGPTLDAAIETYRTITGNRWNDSHIYGESVHPLDDLSTTHAPFVVTDYSPEHFIPWDEIRTPVYEHDGRKILSTERYTPIFYHYWQIFWLAAIYRSGVTLHYPLDDDDIGRAVFHGDLGSKFSPATP